MYYLFGSMPSYRHKDTGKRFFFIHIPKTAGRFLQENFKLNGFEPEQNIWDWIDGIVSRFVDELPEKNLNKNDIFENRDDDDLDFNQDIEYDSEIKSPGWLRYQKKLK